MNKMDKLSEEEAILYADGMDYGAKFERKKWLLVVKKLKENWRHKAWFNSLPKHIRRWLIEDVNEFLEREK